MKFLQDILDSGRTHMGSFCMLSTEGDLTSVASGGRAGPDLLQGESVEGQNCSVRQGLAQSAVEAPGPVAQPARGNVPVAFWLPVRCKGMESTPGEEGATTGEQGQSRAFRTWSQKRFFGSLGAAKGEKHYMLTRYFNRKRGEGGQEEQNRT